LVEKYPVLIGHDNLLSLCVGYAAACADELGGNGDFLRTFSEDTYPGWWPVIVTRCIFGFPSRDRYERLFTYRDPGPPVSVVKP
jgi:hypothetical protein